MKHSNILLLFVAVALSSVAGLHAQSRFGGVVEFDRTIHDFGDIQASQGPVSCTYNVRNISKQDITILNVVTSCGCTDVKWTRETIKPGATGSISATYKNDEGAYPFDKTLTAYVANQVVVLHLRGVVHEKAVALDKAYPVHFGAFAMRSASLQAGNMVQGQQKSGEVMVANIGNSPIAVSFEDVSPGLKLTISNTSIPAGKTATLTYTITSDREHWGRQTYYATPKVNGKAYGARIVPVKEKKAEKGAEALVSEPDPNIGDGKQVIGVSTFVKDDFSGLSREQRANGSNPMFESSSFSFGTIKAGTKVNASFPFKNIGKSTFHIYKADTDSHRVKISPHADVSAGGSGKIQADLDTSGLPAGEVLFILTLTTDSPLRPMVNLYITGFIK